MNAHLNFNSTGIGIVANFFIIWSRTAPNFVALMKSDEHLNRNGKNRNNLYQGIKILTCWFCCSRYC